MLYKINWFELNYPRRVGYFYNQHISAFFFVSKKIAKSNVSYKVYIKKVELDGRMVVPRMLSLKRLVAAFSKCILELLAIDRDTEESSLLLMKNVLKKSMDGRARWLGLALVPEEKWLAVYFWSCTTSGAFFSDQQHLDAFCTRLLPKQKSIVNYICALFYHIQQGMVITKN